MKKTVSLAVPGGLAGQLFAVAFALWLATKRDLNVHIRFHDLNTNISQLSVQELLGSRTARMLGITFSVAGAAWPPKTNSDVAGQPSTELSPQEKTVSGGFTKTGVPLGLGIVSRLSVLDFTRRKLKLGKKRWPALALHRKKLLKAAPGQVLVGYPSDLSVIEESWATFRQVLTESGKPNFADNVATEEFVAVHWRLGDYVGNSFHGVVAWDSIFSALRERNVLGRPIKVFTDSPELAIEIIKASGFPSELQVLSGPIWEDIYEMTRAKMFVGTNSQVSLLVATALKKGCRSAEVLLPRPFFKTPKWRNFFHPPSRYRLRFTYYAARFMDLAAPRE